MDGKDLFEQALTSLLLNRVRTFLTILGLAVGVGAIIAIGSLGYAGISEVQSEFKRFGVDRLWISTTGSQSLSQGDVDTLSKSEPEMTFCPMRYSRGLSIYGGQSAAVQMVGTLPQYRSIENFEMSSGRFLLEQDQGNALRVVVIEDILANSLGLSNPIGETIAMGNGKFVIVGVIQTVYSSFINGESITPKAYMPLSCFEQYFGGEALDEITVCVRGDVDQSILSIRRLLSQIDPNQKYVISSLRGQIQTADRVMSIFIMVLACVGAICMLTGGIGVMNVLLTAVRERKREIGIRKAVGAKNTDIAMQFVFEALIYGGIGALAGIALGFIFSRLGGMIVKIDVEVSAQMVIISVVFSCLIGLVSGVYPALRASKVPPVAAMRSAM